MGLLDGGASELAGRGACRAPDSTRQPEPASERGCCFVTTNAAPTAGDLDTLTSVGVLLTPCHDGYRDWDTTMYGITGDPELTGDELQQYRELWNRSPEADAVDGRASGVE